MYQTYQSIYFSKCIIAAFWVTKVAQVLWRKCRGSSQQWCGKMCGSLHVEFECTKGNYQNTSCWIRWGSINFPYIYTYFILNVFCLFCCYCALISEMVLAKHTCSYHLMLVSLSVLLSACGCTRSLEFRQSLQLETRETSPHYRSKESYCPVFYCVAGVACKQNIEGLCLWVDQLYTFFGVCFFFLLSSSMGSHVTEVPYMSPLELRTLWLQLKWLNGQICPLFKIWHKKCSNYSMI